MRISELAAKSGLSIDTIRYYEKRGLLGEAHMHRRPSGYRVYNEKALGRLRLIRRGQQLGFTLGELAEHLKSGRPSPLTRTRYVRSSRRRS